MKKIKVFIIVKWTDVYLQDKTKRFILDNTLQASIKAHNELVNKVNLKHDDWCTEYNLYSFEILSILSWVMQISQRGPSPV